ncbi:MAG: DMT family transporter, partial [Rubrimonas sp.]
MTATPAAELRRANLAGGAWMVAAMAGFAVEDALIKRAAAEMAVGQTLTLFGLGGAAVFGALALARGERLFAAGVRSPAMLTRAAFEVTGRLFYVLARALTPLSATTAILQATPVVVVIGAAAVFGERVGALRWAAVALGLVGVMIVLRPAAEGFSALSILAVIGMIGFAGRDLASRAAPRSLGGVTLGFHGFLAAAVAGALFWAFGGAGVAWPAAGAALALAGASAVGVFAYAALMRAMRTGEVSAVAPFRYARLPFGAALGVVVFGEALDAATVLGS